MPPCHATLGGLLVSQCSHHAFDPGKSERLLRMQIREMIKEYVDKEGEEES